jgi:hypothetical protein
MCVAKRRGDPRWSEQIDFDCGVERGVEGNRRRRVDDDVTRRQQLRRVVVETEAVRRHVTGDGDETAGYDLVEGCPELVAEAIEAVVSKDFASSPLGRTLPPTSAD